MHLSNKRISLGLLIFAIGILLISFGLIINYMPRKIPNINPNDNQNLLGQDRLEKQNELIKTIKNYLSSIPNLNVYLTENNIRKISLMELKNKFNIDMNELENEANGCDLEKTMIDFSKGYDDYIILLVCDFLTLK